MKISLCMIVKNEEKNLRRCLQSVMNAVDEIIIVDTGSTDKTCEIARQFGALVEHFEWNGSFSDARNQSLAKARGEWILFLDADEELAPESTAVLHRLVEDSSISGYSLRIENYVGDAGAAELYPDLVFRLFRNRPEHRFQGAIHEQIACVIRQHDPEAKFGLAEDFIIRHYGYLTQQITEKDKKSRNLRMLEAEFRKNPDDKLLRYHYGVELYGLGNSRQAAFEFIKAGSDVDVNTIYLPKLMRYLVLCYYGDKNYEDALNIIKQGLGWFPAYADLYYYQGQIYYEQEEYGLAYDAFARAVATPPQPSHYATFSGVRGFRSYYYLGLIAELFCNEEEALRHYISSLRDNAAFTAPLECICRILQPYEDPVYAKQALETVCEFESREANLCIAEFLMNQSAYDLAYQYFAEAAGKGEETSAIKINKAICLMQQRQFAAAANILDGISLTDSLCRAAVFNKIVCYWLQGCQQEVRQLSEAIMPLALTEDSAGVVGILKYNLGKRNFSKVYLGETGVAILLDVFKRTVALGEWDRALTLLDGVRPECLSELNMPVGEICFQYGNMNLAEQYLTSHIDKNPQADKAYSILGQVKERQGLYVDAHYCYRQAMNLKPKNPSNYIRLARLYEKMRRDIVQQAIEKYHGAAVLHPLMEEVQATHAANNYAGNDCAQ
jgi:glycosyltransferase involved in cell wall biosynthesis